ncbi:Arm DNA-binding domain-containing protein [Paracoccaceae bacterium]|nr:Arm DNA-binding domain-containing protein [Paracoccaceae bacterium]
MTISGKLTKKLIENLGAGRHGDGNGLYLVVDPSGARRWIVRVVVKGQTNKKGAPLRTDFGLGGADIIPLNQARERALEYRRMAKQGLNPRFNAKQKYQPLKKWRNRSISNGYQLGKTLNTGNSGLIRSEITHFQR